MTTSVALSASFDGIEKVQRFIDKFSGSQLDVACVSAINDSAFRVRAAMRAEMDRAFSQPTSYIRSSVWVGKASVQNMQATVAPTYFGGKGIDPQRILDAQATGGRRSDKRSEVALRRAGILPGGYQTVIPADPYPGSADAHGNLRGSFLQQLLSYFAAYSEVGYKANMTDKRKANIHRGTKTRAARRYFVSYGRLRGGRTGHLAPGIWAASGTGSVILKPVLMFVRAPNYRERFSMQRVAEAADIASYQPRRLRYHIYKLAEDAGLK